MPSKKVALFVDVETLFHQLKKLHHRILDPGALIESSQAHGELLTRCAIANWGNLPASLSKSFAEANFELVQVDRAIRCREFGGRRREVIKDLVNLELLAQIIDHLFKEEGGSELDVFVLGTGDSCSLRTLRLVRDRFHKQVNVVGIEGGLCEDLRGAASAWEYLPMPPVEPTDLEGLSKLVPLLENLEQRKRYLNFKYIRETVVRRLELPTRTFEAAEQLLSEAIACGLLMKQKIEDKYNPGQFFTAYALERESELFKRFGSGEPAPEHIEPAPPAQAEAPGEEQTAIPTPARRPKTPRSAPAPGGRPRGPHEEGRSGGQSGPPKRKRRRRRRRANSADNAEPAQLSAGSQGGRGRRKKGARNHGQDRVGRAYEAPSRFLQEVNDKAPDIKDEDIDEDQILKALGDF